MENETSQGTGTILLDPTKQAVDYDHFPLERLGRTHFIGIGGAGMSVLAEMLLEKGIPVSGSDGWKPWGPPSTWGSRLRTLLRRIRSSGHRPSSLTTRKSWPPTPKGPS